MEYKEYSGKTVEEALTGALIQMGVTSDQIEYEVIEKGSSGFLGVGSKDALIRVRKKETAPEPEEDYFEGFSVSLDPIDDESQEPEAAEEKTSEEPEEISCTPEEAAADFLNAVLPLMGVKAHSEITMYEDNVMEINIEGRNTGILIGKRGQTLDALQYLVSLAANKHSSSYIRVKLDTENYRQRREETLENLAHNIAAKVKRTGREVSLEPMNPNERRIIHAALQNDPYVTTHSEGENIDRHVIVTPADDK